LAVKIILRSIFIHKLLQFVDVLLVKFYIAFHIAEVSAVSLQLAISASLQTLRFRRFSFKLFFVLGLLAFEFIVKLAILILYLWNCLLLYSVLFLELLLHLVGIVNILALRFFFCTCDTVLCGCNLLPHLNIAASQSFEFFLHATFIEFMIAQCTDMISDYLLVHGFLCLNLFQ
jgi:hypothetical protein